MLGCTYKVKVLTLYFIHHSIHFFKAHNAGNYLTSYHIRRYAVGKALVYHKIARIRQHRRVQARNVAHKVIKALTRNLAGSVLINAVKKLHNIGMVRNFKIGVRLLTKLLNLNIFAVVLTHRHARVHYIRYFHLYFGNLFLQLILFFFKGFKLLCLLVYKALHFFRLVALALRH